MNDQMWWCTVHESRLNSVLDSTFDEGHDPGMWGGCYFSLWSFASGRGNGGKPEDAERVGRCHFLQVTFHE